MEQTEPDWRSYELKVHRLFNVEYPQYEILFNEKVPGRYSKVDRQVDILVKANVVGINLIGVFDCKHFKKSVDVKAEDSMVGFMDDTGAHFGGLVSSSDFTPAAIERANNPKIDLRIIPFESPEQVISYFVPSMNFSGPRNSGYVAAISAI